MMIKTRYFQGVCEKTIQDVVERFWDIIEDININNVLGFLRDNIVGVVVLVTAFVWIPASCVVSYLYFLPRSSLKQVTLPSCSSQ